MRNLGLAALALVAASACAGGAEEGFPSGADTDPVDRVPKDAAAPFEAAMSLDTGSGTTQDTGGGTDPDAEGDGDSGTDADSGSPPPVDSGGAKETSVADTAPPEAGTGTTCTSPIDISAGGTFTVDTCTSTASIAASCGTTADAIVLRADAPSTGSTYEITFPSGWVLVETDGTCTPMPDSCGSTGTWSVSGITSASYWYFAVEPESGTCATTTVTVDRLM
jgi:hypothetical protein